MFQLDHVVIAAPDLQAARAAFAEQTGTEPIDGGPHIGLGTRNALVSFGGGRYLEIIAPDPEQDTGGSFGAALAGLDEPRMLHFAVRVEGLQDAAERVRACGLQPGAIRRTSRATPAGETLVWELMGVGGHGDGGFVPFFIDWLDCVHPADTSPVVGELLEFRLRMPAGHAVHALLSDCAGITLAQGDAQVTVRHASAGGEIEWTGRSLAGFRM